MRLHCKAIVLEERLETCSLSSWHDCEINYNVHSLTVVVVIRWYRHQPNHKQLELLLADGRRNNEGDGARGARPSYYATVSDDKSLRQ